MKKNCIILANGTFPTAKEPLEALRTADYICCCDGAVEKLVNAGLMPDVIIGDGDSIPAHLRERFAEIFLKESEQEYNDLSKATRHCLGKGFSQIKYLGATGLREDHTLGNIFLMPFYFRELGVQPTMLTDEGLFTVHQGEATLESHAGQQVSIFNISCRSLSGTGLQYPLSPFAQLWQGTLNEALGERFCVKADGLYMVFRTHK